MTPNNFFLVAIQGLDHLDLGLGFQIRNKPFGIGLRPPIWKKKKVEWIYVLFPILKKSLKIISQ